MKKRRIMALVTAAAMAMGLAGCGGGSAATATTAAPAETEKTTEAAVTEAAEAAKSEGSDNWKVAILTGPYPRVRRSSVRQNVRWRPTDRSTS